MNMLWRGGVAVVVFVLFFAGPAFAQVPGVVNYQGRLLNGTNLVNASVDMEIGLWTNAAGPGAPLLVDSNRVSVVDGLYSVLVGDNPVIGTLTNALKQTNLYLSVRINGNWMFPRESLSSVAYALLADGVKSGGVSASMLADNAVHSNHIAHGAIATVHLANGAVTSSKIELGAITGGHLATGAVGHAQLARDYQAGEIDCAGMAATNSYDFAKMETNVTIAFSPAFGSTPIMTLGIESTDRSAITQCFASVAAKSENGFVVAASLSPGARLLDTNSYFRHLSMAVINGHPAVAYQDNTKGSLKYARANDPYGLTWGAPVNVNTNDESGVEACLMEFNGAPVIAYNYIKSMNGDLMYVRALDAEGNTWAAPVAIDTNVSDSSVHPSLAVVENRPAVSYDQRGSLAYARADDDYGSNWVRVTVYTNINTGLYSSLAVINGYPAIAFDDDIAGLDRVMYIRALDIYGVSWWASSAIVETNVSPMYITLAEVGGRPAVSYFDSENDSLKYVRANNSTGGTWSASAIVLVESNNNAGSYAQMALVNSYPAIGYVYYALDQIRYCRADSSTGSSWNEPVSPAPVDAASALSMAVVAGCPAIVYADDTPKHLRFIRSGSPPTNAVINWIAVEP